MYIIPYYTKEIVSSCGFILVKASIFLTEYGKFVWFENETVENIISNYLEPNGLYGDHVKSDDKDVLYYKIDSRTRLEDFYTYEENGEQCWRTFYTIMAGNQIQWERQQEDFTLGSYGSINRFWSSLRSNHNNNIE